MVSLIYMNMHSVLIPTGTTYQSHYNTYAYTKPMEFYSKYQGDKTRFTALNEIAEWVAECCPDAKILVRDPASDWFFQAVIFKMSEQDAMLFKLKWNL